MADTLLAELEMWHSRPIAPTRRLALGDCHLPTNPAPGPGGLLLGAVLARFGTELDRDLYTEILALMAEVERGVPIGQPRLRHRLQRDRVGLSRSRHRLFQGRDGLRFSLETAKGNPAQSALAAVYACEAVPSDRREAVMAVLRRGLDWVGPFGPGLVDHLVGRDVAQRLRAGEFTLASDPLLWALGILGLEADTEPRPREVQKRYRRLLRDAHPDHGASENGAAARIADLSRARKILLS